MGIYKKILIWILIIFSVAAFSLSDEEKARLSFDNAMKLWLSGQPEKALKLLEETLYKPIDVRDIPKFWYLKAKIEVDFGNVDDAIKDLRNVLAIDPGSVEVVYLLKRIEYLLDKIKFEKKYKTKELFTVNGIRNSIEYFYTINDVAAFGDTVFGIDSANKRLLVFKDKNLWSTINLSFTPVTIAVSQWGDVFISSKRSVYRWIYGTHTTTEVATNLNTPVLAGFDRSGNLWGFAGFRIFKISGEDISFYDFDSRILPMDCEVAKDGLWILDVIHRRIVFFSFEREIITKGVPLPFNVRAFEATPLGDFLLLTDDGEIYALKNGENAVKLPIDGKNTVAFEYTYPVLLLTDWRKRQLKAYIVSDGAPVFVNIDNLEYNEQKRAFDISVRVENIEGEPMPFASHYTYFFIDNSKVMQKPVFDLKSVPFYRSTIDFISDKLPHIKRGIGYDILVTTNVFYKKGDILSLRDKGVRLYLDDFPKDETLRWLAFRSGGDVSSSGPVNSYRQIWKAEIPYIPGIETKITSISAQVALFDEIYSDTLFYVERGIYEESGNPSEGGS
ncbi:MAG: hypothetical protein J7L34_00810 [Thermotogaceae bacterium]|nr:hypothetical protein [Thermotogaceae bacterium]